MEVKLKCKKSDSPSAVSIYLLEPKTCEYVLGVESPLVCDILSTADEYGLMKISSKADFTTTTPNPLEQDDTKEEPTEKSGLKWEKFTAEDAIDPDQLKKNDQKFWQEFEQNREKVEVMYEKEMEEFYDDLATDYNEDDEEIDELYEDQENKFAKDLEKVEKYLEEERQKASKRTSKRSKEDQQDRP